ncbi:MAG: hypothetical protein IPK65_03730 [Gammaproteobacteria bacterium]|nr:hypothetical protein [Gammaproteobacteria bacterium]
MHGKDDVVILAVEVLDEDATLTLAELCRTCGVHEDWIAQLVVEGVPGPPGHAGSGWRFPGSSLHRAPAARSGSQSLRRRTGAGADRGNTMSAWQWRYTSGML